MFWGCWGGGPPKCLEEGRLHHCGAAALWPGDAAPASPPPALALGASWAGLGYSLGPAPSEAPPPLQFEEAK